MSYLSLYPQASETRTQVYSLKWLLHSDYSSLFPFPHVESKLPSLITLPQNLQAHFLFCFNMTNHSRDVDQFLHL